jgi:hypothetical protein
LALNERALALQSTKFSDIIFRSIAIAYQAAFDRPAKADCTQVYWPEMYGKPEIWKRLTEAPFSRRGKVTGNLADRISTPQKAAEFST